MPIFPHDEIPWLVIDRITTRVLVSRKNRAANTEVWQQWMTGGGHIPLHYHEVEEVLVILRGRVEVALNEETREVNGPATILVPPLTIHGMRQLGDEQVELLAMFPVTDPKVFSPEGNETVLPWQDGGSREGTPS